MSEEMMLLVGVAGKKRSGKGSVSQFVSDWAISRSAPLLTVDYGFADMLKWATMRMFIPEITKETAILLAEELKDQDASRAILLAKGKEIASITVRQLLQHGGTEMGRELFGESFWVDQLFGDNFAGMRDEEGNLPDIATFSDVRFENEARAIRERGGQTWLVVRGEDDGDAHSSETPLSPDVVDWVIANDGDLDQLRQRVYTVCEDRLASVVSHA